ncbi:purine-binding chemotaxis protein CheW [Metabacillus sp. KIGAM252]|uniref:Purine-binding chemotaxis protein CheW n=1 Tax=Metabacillus flavus TaxID=2823519 RepID=A0ABS5LE45_9BACI|nr:chemotaxis protein CheW [Metabacillus flavus]MBS2969005.1 purine-binding chemotaxis protein CheW [Metabacillus flavus]
MQTNESIEKKIIIFRLGEEEFGIPVELVKSIEKVQSITRVPGTASYITGVLNLRGVITPVIDLRERFELGSYESTELTRMIVVSINDTEAGLIADSANDVIDIRTEQIEPSPEVAGIIKTDYISGVVKVDKRLIIMLDLEEVLHSAPSLASSGA